MVDRLTKALQHIQILSIVIIALQDNNVETVFQNQSLILYN